MERFKKDLLWLCCVDITPETNQKPWRLYGTNMSHIVNLPLLVTIVQKITVLGVIYRFLLSFVFSFFGKKHELVSSNKTK